jgi:hypothetical protein
MAVMLVSLELGKLKGFKKFELFGLPVSYPPTR